MLLLLTQTHTGGPATSCVVLRMMCFDDVLSAESFLIQCTCRMGYVMLICTPTKEQRDTTAGGGGFFQAHHRSHQPIKGPSPGDQRALGHKSSQGMQIKG